MLLTRMRPIIPQRRLLHNPKRPFFCHVANETEHLLNLNNYKYPVTLTKCTDSSKQHALPTVLLPAMGQNITDYPWLKEHLSQYSDVITIGHTSTPHESVHENARYFIRKTLNGFDTDIACIRNAMDYFKVTKGNFVGISFGGMMTHLFARQHPQFVNSMLLSSCGLYISNLAETNIMDGFAFLNSGDHKSAAKLTADTFSTNPLSRRILTKHFCSILRTDIYSKQYTLCLERVVTHFHHKRYQSMLNLPMIGENIESMLICAKSDALFPFHSSLRLAETIKNCRVENVEGGHLWMLNKDKQEIFCQKAGDFLYRFGNP